MFFWKKQKKKEIIYNAVIFYMAAFFCTKKGTDSRLSLKFYLLLVVCKSVVDS